MGLENAKRDQLTEKKWQWFQMKIKLKHLRFEMFHVCKQRNC
jgi:hypothetical protein